MHKARERLRWSGAETVWDKRKEKSPPADYRAPVAPSTSRGVRAHRRRRTLT
jgi:hypothetical protein